MVSARTVWETVLVSEEAIDWPGVGHLHLYLFGGFGLRVFALVRILTLQSRGRHAPQ